MLNILGDIFARVKVCEYHRWRTKSSCSPYHFLSDNTRVVETMFPFYHRSYVTHAQDEDMEMFRSFRPTKGSTLEECSSSPTQRVLDLYRPLQDKPEESMEDQPAHFGGKSANKSSLISPCLNLPK